MLDAQIGEPQHAHALRHVVEDVVGDGGPRSGYTSRFPLRVHWASGFSLLFKSLFCVK